MEVILNTTAQEETDILKNCLAQCAGDELGFAKFNDLVRRVAESLPFWASPSRKEGYKNEDYERKADELIEGHRRAGILKTRGGEYFISRRYVSNEAKERMPLAERLSLN